MKKRITSLLMAVVILFGVISAGAFHVSAEADFHASQECINILKEEEGFSVTPYWDYTQYTVGYGSTCPSDMVDYYTANGITEAEAEVLLQNHLIAIERDINQRIIDKYQLNLTQNQFDALVMFSYNCGTGWAFDPSGTFHTAIATSATGNDLVRAFALWCAAGDEVKTFLLRRRLCEANMYLNGVYSTTPPENYCYVIYEANGGYSSPRSQGYDSALTAEPFPVPTYAGYTFDGWYTERTGGTKVTVLDASTKNMTLYAHWLDANGNPPVVNEDPVNITVTGTDVNLRKGPGTNYSVIGTAQKGDQMVITETASGSGYRWGKFDGGWICLTYTNYDTAVQEQTPVDPPATDPAPTDPPATEPPVTEPPVTEPPATEPPATEPPATEPPAPEPAKVMGTVRVNEFLRVRSGPSTGYSEVTRLKPNDRVEILEQKTVGAMIWGRISNGWISMDYVTLDNPGAADNSGSSGAAGQWKGTIVNCNELRIRSDAGTNYSIVGYLKAGTVVDITEKKTNGSMVWGKISTGWISLDYVELSTDGAEAQPSEKLTGTVNVQEFLRVRNGPGTSYALAGYLKPNEKVEISERKTVGGTVWGKISNGWISMDYIILDGQGSAGDTGSTPSAQTKTIVADCLRVRSDAGTGNSIVGYLYYGAKVEILETKNAADGVLWGRISNGWISMDYAK